VALRRQRHHPSLVAGKRQAVEQERVDLSLKLLCGPAGIDRLGLLKSSRLRRLHAQENPIMCPGQF
jgi:hypothetical protein